MFVAIVCSKLINVWLIPLCYTSTVFFSSYPFGYGGAYCFNSTKQGDGMDCGVFPYMSGLINGKGRDQDGLYNSPMGKAGRWQ